MSPPPSDKSSPPPVRACLFDMDGLLIDSEDLYTTCTNEMLSRFGKPGIPWSIKAQLQGRPGPEAGEIFHAWAQLPISPEEYQTQVSALQRQHFPTTQPLPGVATLLQTLATRPDPAVHLALATSSHAANFRLKTAHLPALFAVFDPPHRVLGDDPRIPPGRGKPAPDIYLLALDTVNAARRERGDRALAPAECLVFEDSVPGVEAGRRAGMQVVWCPHPGLWREYEGREAEVLAGSTGGEEREERSARPGEDGWARLLESLDDFPYREFGIEL